MRLDQFPPWLRYAVALTALGLIIYEAVLYRGEPRWSLLVVYTAMLGIPTLMVRDSQHHDDDPPPGPPVHDDESPGGSP